MFCWNPWLDKDVILNNGKKKWNTWTATAESHFLGLNQPPNFLQCFIYWTYPRPSIVVQPQNKWPSNLWHPCLGADTSSIRPHTLKKCLKSAVKIQTHNLSSTCDSLIHLVTGCWLWPLKPYSHHEHCTRVYRPLIRSTWTKPLVSKFARNVTSSVKGHQAGPRALLQALCHYYFAGEKLMILIWWCQPQQLNHQI